MSFGSGSIRRRRDERRPLPQSTQASGGRAERRDNAPALGEQVRHIERLVIDGYGLADPTALVIEPINTGHCANAGNAGGHREHCPLHGKPKSVDAQFDELERRDLLGPGRSGYRQSRTALNLGLHAVTKTPSQRGVISSLDWGRISRTPRLLSGLPFHCTDGQLVTSPQGENTMQPDHQREHDVDHHAS